MVKQNWLITGGCGFLGCSLFALLREQGQNVRMVDNLSVGRLADLPLVEPPVAVAPQEMGSWDALTVVKADIRAADVALKVCEGADVIIHLAANTGVMPSIANPRLDCETNVTGVLNYLEGARAHGVKRFVLASSSAPVGEQEPPIHEEMPAHPMSPYGASKLAGEGYCSAYWHSFGVETIALRFGNVFGPGSMHKGSVVALFIRRALANEDLIIYGTGQQTRDFIYINDLRDAIVAAATKPGLNGGEVIQIATGRERTVGEVAEALSGLLLQKTGKAPTIIHEGERVGEMLRNYSDTSKARRLLDYDPQTVFADGLEQTLDYFLAKQA